VAAADGYEHQFAYWEANEWPLGYGWQPAGSHFYHPPLRTGLDPKWYFRRTHATLLRLVIGPSAVGSRVTVTGLDRELCRLRPDRGSQRSQIYSYLAAAVVPNAPLGWDIAAAIRACGLEWFMGPVVLVAAGHYSDFFGVLANIGWPGSSPLFEILANTGDVVATGLAYGCDQGELAHQLLKPASHEYSENDYVSAIAAIEIAWGRWMLCERRFRKQDKHLAIAAEWLARAPVNVHLRGIVLREIVMDYREAYER